MRNELSTKKCVPCEGGTPPIDKQEAENLSSQVPNWELSDKKITRTFKFKKFAETVDFFNEVAAIAEEEGHHPDFEIKGVRNLTLTLWTHAVGGLTANDFIVAAKIDQIQRGAHE